MVRTILRCAAATKVPVPIAGFRKVPVPVNIDTLVPVPVPVEVNRHQK